MDDTKQDLKKKIEGAHEKHAWTLALIVFAALCAFVYWLDEWLKAQRGDWSELASVVLYVASFFAIFGLSTVKDWFLDRIREPDKPEPIHAPFAPALHFKDAKSALDYSCKYMDTSFKDGEFTPCIVVATSSSKEAGLFAVIDVPSSSGLKRCVGEFSTETAPDRVAGKLCAAMIGPPVDGADLPAFLIFAELEPTWSNGAWKISRYF